VKHIDDTYWIKERMMEVKELNQEDIGRRRGRHGGMVSLWIWKHLICSGRMHSLSGNGEGKLTQHPANPGSSGRWPLNRCVYLFTLCPFCIHSELLVLEYRSEWWKSCLVSWHFNILSLIVHCVRLQIAYPFCLSCIKIFSFWENATVALHMEIYTLLSNIL